MATLQRQFERFIKREHLFGPSDKLLLAVSGGVDSIVLVHLMHSLNYKASVVHCNFQLRGEDSDHDAALVEAIAKKHNLPFYHKKFNTSDYAESQHLSTQLAARELRYQWFDELVSAHSFDYLITAHHGNDQIETMLYNLIKGTGAAGLRGIPLRTDQIRRPLLFAKREEIEAYAKEHKLKWREDASNKEDKYRRNRIRLRVVPELKHINPGLEKTMSNNSKRFDALEKLLLNQVTLISKEYLNQNNNGYSLSMSWYKASEGSLAVLVELLRPFGFNADQCFSIDEIIDNTESNSVGKQFYSAQYVLAIDRGTIQIVSVHSDEKFELMINKSDEFVSTPLADFSLELANSKGDWPKDKKVAYLDAQFVEFPIKVRNWKQGDSFYPLGMNGKKKLSDFMIDEKIPVNLKSRVVLFESKKDIIWVAGHRIDDRYKITPKTKRVLIIKMTDHV
ncbi:MAG: tRNA lysidine(34) synthetase TilS [Reichenbachiella sp.]|uniref:tRNA lysidine(34) synthetase TilS n=3 Tax=Reichenbachiella sp. TaxID=2184521 RepID=UPI00326305D8